MYLVLKELTKKLINNLDKIRNFDYNSQSELNKILEKV